MPPVRRNVSASSLKCETIFETIAERVKAEPAKAKAINAIFLYNITKDGKQVKQWSKYIITLVATKKHKMLKWILI